MEPEPIVVATNHDHIYESTACQHDLHDECRKECKWCEEPCSCSCHLKESS